MAGSRYFPDPDDPLAHARGLGIDGLLTLLARLDGAEECAVVRGALGAGMPPSLVLDELRREVERRLLRIAQAASEHDR